MPPAPAARRRCCPGSLAAFAANAPAAVLVLGVAQPGGRAGIARRGAPPPQGEDPRRRSGSPAAPRSRRPAPREQTPDQIVALKAARAEPGAAEQQDRALDVAGGADLARGAGAGRRSALHRRAATSSGLTPAASRPSAAQPVIAGLDSSPRAKPKPPSPFWAPRSQETAAAEPLAGGRSPARHRRARGPRSAGPRSRRPSPRRSRPLFRSARRHLAPGELETVAGSGAASGPSRGRPPERGRRCRRRARC